MVYFTGNEAEYNETSDSSSSKNSSQQCAWCHKTGTKQVTLDTPTGVKVFCNEICFTQCRRASFKKSKTCDWCKHVRHTVNYVEFKDGETQLQFCSEKCLNQYKMSIFCKETQEHLRNVDKNGENPAELKNDEREILITPELWMRGEHARRAAEARESARERERLERREEREHRKINTDKSPSKINYKLENAEKTKEVVFDRIKQETNRHRRSLLTDRETERSSPVRIDKHTSPPVNSDTSYSAHIMSVSPWLHQAQFMGALVPGIIPYGHLSPMLLPGMLPPPPPPQVLVPETKDTDNQEDVKKDKKSQSRRHTTPSLLSPSSDISVTSGPSLGQETQSRVSPGLVERRTSSLFPVDFPQFFTGQNVSPGMPNTPIQQTGIPGIPPVTMMVPFPVPLPLPVPVPIPIPLTVQQLKEIFGDKNEDNTNHTSVFPKVNPERVKDSKSPITTHIHSPQSVASCGSDFNSFDKQESRSGSRNSCPDLSLFIGVHDLRTKPINRQQIKRSRTPETMKSLDLSRRSKIQKYDYNFIGSDSNDGVIDLSASRLNGQKSEDTESENDANILNASNDTSVSRDDTDSNTGDAPTIPKIHIITHKDETPLNQPLPLPPTENSYSSRRGLILDAPTVQKKSRSPSPERRVYVRNVPRDIIEAARRRCMRARIRTK